MTFWIYSAKRGKGLLASRFGPHPGWGKSVKLGWPEKGVDLNPSLVEKLRLWVCSGGSVRVGDLSESEAVIELCACNGEIMERFSSSDRTLIEYLALTEMGVCHEDSGAPTGSTGEH